MKKKITLNHVITRFIESEWNAEYILFYRDVCVFFFFCVSVYIIMTRKIRRLSFGRIYTYHWDKIYADPQYV
jgi:hypothetical protein